MNVNWTIVVSDLLIAFIPIIMGVIGMQLIKFLNMRNANSATITLAKEAYGIVAIAVNAMNQTFVDALKSEGGFTPAKQQEAKSKCLEILQSMLNDAMKVAIEIVYGNLDTVLDVFIESAVRDAKLELE